MDLFPSSADALFLEGRGESVGRIAYKGQKGSDHETTSWEYNVLQ